MDIAMATALAGAVIGFGGGFFTAAIITMSKAADLRDALVEQDALIRSQSKKIEDYRAAEQRRGRQRKAKA